MSPNTHAIGTGTRNTAWNAPLAFLLILARLVFQQGLSMAAFVRSAVVHEVERTDPETAARLRSELKRYYGSIVLGLFTLAHFALAANSQASGVDCDELRQAPRAHRVTRGKAGRP